MITVNCKNRVVNPWNYSNFNSYWGAESSSFKNIQNKNIIWRVKHRNNWVSMNGTFMWLDFLIYSSPIIPTKLKAYISYKRNVGVYDKLTEHIADEYAKEINKKLLEEIMKEQRYVTE